MGLLVRWRACLVDGILTGLAASVCPVKHTLRSDSVILRGGFRAQLARKTGESQ